MKRDIYFQILTYHKKLSYPYLTTQARIALLTEYTRFVEYLYITHYFTVEEFNACILFAHNIAAIYKIKMVITKK